jgi:hypothetical protein
LAHFIVTYSLSDENDFFRDKSLYCGEKLYNNQGYLLHFSLPILVEIGWWAWALLNMDTWLGRFAEASPNVGAYYYMTITMLFASLIAGATSEGGGAVAFPVNLHIFSL